MDNVVNKSESYAVKLKIALDLMQFSYELQRQNITRKNPNDTKESINTKLQEWINASSLISSDR